ncbi:triose-phosphate isomerase [Candidatus Woesearchaeota archaeon]|nr:triose-phosphate isomerase [Candidatus Woesearchaeota archaeon]
MRKRFIAGNWKMHKTKEESLAYMQEFRQYIQGAKDVDIVLAVPFTLLETIKKEIENTGIGVAAQNIFYEEQGAFTGEVSAAMAKDFADYVIIGHSERRKYFNETNEIVNKKIKAAIGKGLKVIFCLGETQDERNQGKTKQVAETQLREGLAGLTIDNMKSIIIAYEPVWAIGTGNTATPEQAEEVHAFLREILKPVFNDQVAQETRIIYGGSVNPENASAILQKENIDGCLPGGASLDPQKLANIIKSQ